MLTTQQLRQTAALSGARDIAAIEIDVGLTHLLQLFHEKGLMEHLAFKGGTYLRKMVFGPKGRLSTDLDFTCRTGISLDDLTLGLLEALAQPYHGLSFRFDRDKDWYLTDEGCAANPVLAHVGNPTGVKIKIQVSTRERPIRPVQSTPQVEQSYFKFLPFTPADIPSLALEEVIAEKIRAASQRSKIRDLYDLSEIARRPLQKELIRSLAVLKLWNSGGPGLDFERFRTRIEAGSDYDLMDLKNLLRKDQSPQLGAMITCVVGNFQFLAQLTETERLLAADAAHRQRPIAEALASKLATE
ncbi:nucleotidyl transferase AbiEii/AbiGii toxin family protein [Opitutaceae bacterium TAV4]|nr:nucleotidyl transferase AbiEii/AbiGii toxin family protein [Opitutaceae bacterium TAV4]RRK00537.1 nucleotidyl transferase AbiEii/AbiGii toxin family protein [Opitutaceae bacterium TAV3]